MMRIIKSIFPLLIVAFLCISFFSCGEDNPILPIEPIDIDTNDVYQWQIDTAKGYFFSDIYQLDSQHVYFGCYPTPVLYQNGQFTEIGNNDYSFNGLTIQAVDSNYLVAGGWKRLNDIPQYVGAFRIYEGSSIQTFLLPGDSLISDIRDMLIIGKENFWFLNNSEKIYHFDNGKFSVYSINEEFETRAIISSGNEVYINAISIVTPGLKKILKFSGTEFTEVTTLLNPEYADYILVNLESEFIYESLHNLLYVNNNRLEPFSSLPGLNGAVYTGSSRSNIIRFEGLGYDENLVHIWDGIKWKKEKANISFDTRIDKLGITKMKSNHIFLMAASYKNGVSFIVQGKKRLIN